MYRHFRMKLTIILIAFSLLVSLVIAIVDYERLRKTVIHAQHTEVKLAEDKIIHSLSTIDKVYQLFDEQTATQMETNSNELLSLYEREPDFTKWDFSSLSKQFDMDIFILNDENTVIHSSFIEDVGLSFSACCPGLSKLLDERRKGNSFAHDGMDIQSKTGELKKFSYMPTPDGKYLIELGVLLEEDAIFQTFNFISTIESLLNEYEIINSINVYNSGGYLLGVKTENFQHILIEKPYKKIFEEVRSTNETKEFVESENGEKIIYRYIPYTAEVKRGYSTKRVVEIAYNQKVTGLLTQYKYQFFRQLLVSLIGSILLSFLIARLVSKPIHLAFHDSLTGLKNRAAFEDEIAKKVQRNRQYSLLMIDLDNFKIVNDDLGHQEGDELLKVTATTISEVIGSENIAARVGGDEFLVLLNTSKLEKVIRITQQLIRKINEEMTNQLMNRGVKASISIGIAIAKSDDNFETLYEKADRALYQSKENGKNQFRIYVEK